MNAQTSDPRRHRRWVIRLTTVALAAMILYSAVVDAPLPFNKRWWQAGAENWDDSLHRRQRMADWLILFGHLNGKHRSDVVALLGEPPSTEYFKQWNMVYQLGAERSFISIDSEWLVFRLDSGDIVRDVQIVRD